ncbi:MAG: hypothetical protein KTR28_01915 [Micavibrio sp.]|nr:hypothetical protein [Micavibrio sp.]
MRKRISSYYLNNIHHEKFRADYKDTKIDHLIYQQLEQELGIKISTSSSSFGIVFYTEQFLLNCELADFLDSLTIIYFCSKLLGKDTSKKWLDFVERVFREQGTEYSIDSEGDVYPYIDSEFSNSHHSTLISLDKQRYEQAKSIYLSAYSALRADKQNTRTAIKDIFESLETVSKLIDSKIQRLGNKEVSYNLTNICAAKIQDEDEKTFIKEILKGFAKWVDAHHIYRHGQAKEQLTPPSLDSAILSLSIGSAYLRYLIEIDQKIISNQ